MVVQSDWLPMQTATAGRVLVLDMGFVLVSGDVSRDDVGKDAASHKCHLVLQAKFALFQPLQLQLVERLVLRQPLDHVVKVAMLALQHVETRFQDLLFLDVGAVHRLSSRSAGPSASGSASAVSGRTRLAIGSGQFADIRYLFLDMRRAAGLFDGGV